MRELTTKQRRLLRARVIEDVSQEKPDVKDLYELLLLDDAGLATALDAYSNNVITRAREQAAELRERIEQLEAQVNELDTKDDK